MSKGAESDVEVEECDEDEAVDSQTIGDADEAPDLMERSTTRPSLRRLRNLVNSHRNRFEREFNYASVKSRSGNKPKWLNAKKVGRSRSGPEKQVKGSKCARGELSQAMNVIFAQIAKHDKHAQVLVNKVLIPGRFSP